MNRSDAETVPVSPVHPDDELLTAYLDGEVDGRDRQAVESRLVDEPELRQRLRNLQRGWDLLEDLPAKGTQPQLVESTLEMVAVDLGVDVSQTSSQAVAWLRRVPRSYLAGCVLLVVGLLAAWAVGGIVDASRRAAMAQDLAIAEDIDAYVSGDDLELMRTLANEDRLRQLVSATRQLRGESEVDDRLVDIEPEKRLEAIESLSASRRDRLTENWERFSALPDDRKQQLRDVAVRVARQPDAAQILDTMRSYARWRDNLPPPTREAIEGLSGDQRREAIQNALDDSMKSISKWASVMLSEETIAQINLALDEIIRRRLEDSDGPTSQWIRKRRGRMKWLDRPGAVGYVLFSDRDQFPGSGGKFRLPPGLTDDESAMVRLALPADATETIDAIAAGDPLVESMVIRVWVDAVVRANNPFGGSTAGESMMERYLMLSPEQQQKIDLMSPDEAIRALRADR